MDNIKVCCFLSLNQCWGGGGGICMSHLELSGIVGCRCLQKRQNRFVVHMSGGQQEVTGGLHSREFVCFGGFQQLGEHVQVARKFAGIAVHHQRLEDVIRDIPDTYNLLAITSIATIVKKKTQKKNENKLKIGWNGEKMTNSSDLSLSLLSLLSHCCCCPITSFQQKSRAGACWCDLAPTVEEGTKAEDAAANAPLEPKVTMPQGLPQHLLCSLVCVCVYLVSMSLNLLLRVPSKHLCALMWRPSTSNVTSE